MGDVHKQAPRFWRGFSVGFYLSFMSGLQWVADNRREACRQEMVFHGLIRSSYRERCPVRAKFSEGLLPAPVRTIGGANA